MPVRVRDVAEVFEADIRTAVAVDGVGAETAAFAALIAARRVAVAVFGASTAAGLLGMARDDVLAAFPGCEAGDQGGQS